MQGSTVVRAIAAVAVLVFISALALTVYRSGGAALNWEAGASDPVLKFYPSGDGLYVIGQANVSLVDTAGKFIWSVPFNGTLYSAYGNGTLYVYSPDRGLNAIGASGNVTTLTRQGMNNAPIIGPDGTLYLRSWSLLTAMSPSGKELWNVTSVVSDPVVDHPGYVYFFTRPPEHISDVYLVCLAPDGSVRWSTYYDKYQASTKLKASGLGGVIVYDEPTGVLYYVDGSGSPAWEHSMSYLGQYSLVTDEKSRLYMFYLWGTVHILNERGTMLGKFNPVITNSANLTYAPAVYNDTVYVIGDSGKDLATLYALGLDGSLEWQCKFNSSASPTIYASKDIVCVGTQAGSSAQPVLYVIDGAGKIQFTYTSGDGTKWDQVYVGSDETVYAKTQGGLLYALRG